MTSLQEKMTVEDVAPGGQAPEVYRYYELAKKQEWQVRDMPWGDLPPIPETTGSKERVEKRRGIWRSVITQQLQADSLAVEMAAQLLEMARHHDAKLYYSTMAQDEARHVEAWLKLVGEAGGPTERDPYLDKLAHIFLGLDSLEEKVFLMQVFFERMIIPRFRLIARSAPGTVLADLCRRLTIDDGIHHSSGMAYERVLLRTASKQTKERMIKGAEKMLPIFVDHVLWRPKERDFITSAMRTRDIQRVKEEVEEGVKIASSLGLDVRDIEYTIPNA
ncbi:MAG TPA: ferritin-like domain-containing protein [Gaiellaceae bacterium]|nr:ferritin-like domain-containing protein [Gaiellaceae bacterium]